MELIPKDEAIAMLEDMEGRRDEDGYIRVYKTDAIANLRSLSSIDLVRCEECKWGEELAPELIYCDDTIGGVVKRTDFCSYGERRE